MSQMDVYQQYIHVSRYAKYIDELGRRETWEETVERYFTFVEEHLLENNGYKLDKKLRKELWFGLSIMALEIQVHTLAKTISAQ